MLPSSKVLLLELSASSERGFKYDVEAVIELKTGGDSDAGKKRNHENQVFKKFVKSTYR
jgi:hypothetical protein